MLPVVKGHTILQLGECKMRLSITRNLVDAQHSVRRFPLVILCTLVAAYAAIEWIDNSSDPGPFIQLLMASVLGIPFLLTSSRANAPSRVGFLRFV